MEIPDSEDSYRAPTAPEPDEPPPAYARGELDGRPAPGYSSTLSLPAYDPGSHPAPGDAKSTTEDIAGSCSVRHPIQRNSPHCPFPSVINAHGTWSLAGLKTFYLCGATPADRLYLVETHLGNTLKLPLGLDKGALLHNGTDIRDPILAAAGEDTTGALAYRSSTTNTSSIIYVPDEEGGFLKEPMTAVVSEDKEITFRFSKRLKMLGRRQRVQLEWVKFRKGDDSEHPNGGYKLYRRSGSIEAAPSASSSTGQTAMSQRESDVLAVVTWPPGPLSMIRISDLLTIVISKASEGLFGPSEEWRLMVVMTALRLAYLRAKGATNKSLFGLHAEREQIGGAE